MGQFSRGADPSFRHSFVHQFIHCVNKSTLGRVAASPTVLLLAQELRAGCSHYDLIGPSKSMTVAIGLASAQFFSHINSVDVFVLAMHVAAALAQHII